MKHRRAAHRQSVIERFLLIGELYRADRSSILLDGKAVPEIGEKVYNSQLREIGHVSDIFGPVERFYISVKINSGEVGEGFREKERFYVLRVEKRGTTT